MLLSKFRLKAQGRLDLCVFVREEMSAAAAESSHQLNCLASSSLSLQEPYFLLHWPRAEITTLLMGKAERERELIGVGI